MMMRRFFAKLRLSLRKRFMRLAGEDVFVLQRDNILWAVNHRDKRVRYYLKYLTGYGEYEAAHFETLLKLSAVVKPALLIDVGANYGHYTLRLLREVPSLKSAAAFEPAKDMLRWLRINALLNDMRERITIHDIAVGNRQEETHLLIGDGAGTTTLPQSSRAQTMREYYADSEKQPVKVDMLDNVMQPQNEVILIKIDVEGGELAVLEGAKKLLQNNNCLVQAEVFAESREAVLELFNALGYKFFDEIKYTEPEMADMWFVAPALYAQLQQAGLRE